ncbi:MAG TPA: hypothetical protein VF941_12725 [Clostridia bacterium]
MLRLLLNFILFRHLRASKKKQDFKKCLESELVEGFLDILLDLMSIVFFVDKNFRRNIENFNARYLFKDKSDSIHVGAIFENSKLKVVNKEIDNVNVTLIFKDEKALAKFLLSASPDILNALLNQEVDFSGNINYISKFAYMAMHLKLAVMP